MDVLVAPDGTVRMIYSDALSPLLSTLGEVQIARASHVEPAPEGGWNADMGPVGGPVLGPFDLRATALAAEEAYLCGHCIPTPKR